MCCGVMQRALARPVFLLWVCLCCGVLPAWQDETSRLPTLRESARVDDLEVRLGFVEVGRAALKPFLDIGLRDFSTTREPVLLVGLVVKNHSATRRYRYLGWPEQHGLLANASAKDEHGNTYRIVEVLGYRAALDEAGADLEPGGTCKAVVMFERPIQVAQELVIDLRGSALELDDSVRFRFRVTREQWTKAPPSEPPLRAAKPDGKAPAADQAKEPPQRQEPPRTWTIDGRMVEASLVYRVGDRVRLKRSDGTTLDVPMSRLSPADRAYISEWLRRRP